MNENLMKEVKNRFRRTTIEYIKRVSNTKILMNHVKEAVPADDFADVWLQQKCRDNDILDCFLLCLDDDLKENVILYTKILMHLDIIKTFKDLAP